MIFVVYSKLQFKSHETTVQKLCFLQHVFDQKTKVYSIPNKAWICDILLLTFCFIHKYEGCSSRIQTFRRMDKLDRLYGRQILRLQVSFLYNKPLISRGVLSKKRIFSLGVGEAGVRWAGGNFFYLEQTRINRETEQLCNSYLSQKCILNHSCL